MHARRGPLMGGVVMALVLMAGGMDAAQAQFGGSGGIFGGRGGAPRGDRGMGSTPRSAERGPSRDNFQPDPASYEMIDYRLSMLQDDLKLSPAQQPLWRAFSDKTLAYAGDLARESAQEAGQAGAPSL